MQCPYCPEGKSEEYLTETDYLRHLVKEHPEKAFTPESMGVAMGKAAMRQLKYQLAATLTGISFGADGGNQGEVLGRFQWFLKELLELQFD